MTLSDCSIAPFSDVHANLVMVLKVNFIQLEVSWPLYRLKLKMNVVTLTINIILIKPNIRIMKRFFISIW